MAKSSTKDKKVTKKVEKKKVETSESESESSSDSSSSSESESESEDESSSSDSASSDSSSSESGSDSESEDEKEKKKKVKKYESESEREEKEKEDKKKEESESESESSSSSESSSDSDSDSGSESSSDDDEEEKKEQKKDEPSSDSESSSSSSEEEEPKKRKAEEDVSAEPSAKKVKSDETSEPATLFVGRLSWNIDDEWLRREFEPNGGVISARVIMERATGKSRGYGYVDFETRADAERALADYQGKEIDGRPINLDLSTGKPHASKSNDRAKQYGDTPSAPSDTLFIGNLSFNAQRDNLFEIFGEYGTVISCRIPTHPDTQQPKGFGYVQFSSVDEAKAALEALNGEYIEGRACRLDFSTPRDNNAGGNGGNRGGFGGRGGFSGGNRGGRGGFGGNRGGRERSFSPKPTTEFKGTKKTFD